jgi:hypothetical protein
VVGGGGGSNSGLIGGTADPSASVGVTKVEDGDSSEEKRNAITMIGRALTAL